MHRSHLLILQDKFLILRVSLLLALSFVCVACGTNTSSGSSAPIPTAVSNTTGCPNQMVVMTPAPAANVVLNMSSNTSIVNASKGDTVEVDLAFGHLWEEATPTADSQNLLTEQTPSGYANPSSRMCVWRFVATSTGTAHLTFIGHPICNKNQACPMYVMSISFTLNIK